MGFADPAAAVGRLDADLPTITPDQAAYFVQTDREVMATGRPRRNVVEPLRRTGGRSG
jgi:hypothetical protein